VTARYIREKTMLKQRAQTTKPKLENHKELPLHTCKLPLNQCNSPWTNACKPLDENRAATSAQLWLVRPVTTTGQTGAQHVNRASTLTAQTGDPDRSDRCATEPRNGSKPPENLLNAFTSPNHAQTSPPCYNAWIKPKMQKMQPRASQIDKIQQRMLHMSKWAS
jgi:hypothetical protein